MKRTKPNGNWFGRVSAMKMLRALAQGERNPNRMAAMAKMQLRKKIPQLQLALEGRVLPHHRFLLSEMIEDLDHIEAKIIHSCGVRAAISGIVS